MHLLKSFFIAIAMYSKIPVPHMEWKKEDMKYVFIFFPFVGLIIGGLVLGWNFLCGKFGFPEMARVCFGAAIPVIISGGIHVDGFMDTMDALRSYQSREKKLEILKDPHIGAFSVICLAGLGLVYFAALSFIDEFRLWIILGISFVLSRCFSALAAMFFPSASGEGTLYFFRKSSSEILVKIFVFIEMFVCIAGMLLIHLLHGAVAALGTAGTYLYYYLRMKKQLGGITGDTEGWFVVICEGVIAVLLAVCAVLADYGIPGFPAWSILP